MSSKSQSSVTLICLNLLIFFSMVSSHIVPCPPSSQTPEAPSPSGGPHGGISPTPMPVLSPPSESPTPVPSGPSPPSQSPTPVPSGSSPPSKSPTPVPSGASPPTPVPSGASPPTPGPSGASPPCKSPTPVPSGTSPPSKSPTPVPSGPSPPSKSPTPEPSGSTPPSQSPTPVPSGSSPPSQSPTPVPSGSSPPSKSPTPVPSGSSPPSKSPTPVPSCSPTPSQAPTPSSQGNCPIDVLKLGACANVLGNLLGLVIGTPPQSSCCSLIQGLTDLNAAICLCTAIKANVLGINLNVPVSLSLLLNNCGKGAPSGFQCS